MSNGTKLGIGVVTLVLVIYAIFAFDVPYRSPDESPASATAGDDTPILATPAANAAISSPVHMTGHARGTWYFEASLPIEILAPDGSVLGTGHAEATGDWMTTEFVPFTADVSFVAGSSTSGFIRIKNDNPSGDPARDKHIDIPVVFAPTSR